MFNSNPRVDISALVEFDTDGALEETAAKAQQRSRRTFLRNSGLLLGGAVVGSAGLPSVATAATSKGDIAILNFALTLEYLESAFYFRARRNAGLRGELQRFARTVGDHESAHVTALRKVLGSAAVKKPAFDFGAATESPSAFAATAVKLEDTGVMAYQGQAPFIRSQAVFKAAISIHPVEARHAAWIRSITSGYEPAPSAFNPALSKSAVLSAVAATGFIKR